MKGKFTRTLALLLSLLSLLCLFVGCGELDPQDVVDIAGAVLEEVLESDILSDAGAPSEDIPDYAEATPALEASPEPETSAKPTAEPEASAVPEPAPEQTPEPTPKPTPEPGPALDPDGVYDSKEDVSLYLYLYGELPGNFLTKNEARDLGWSGGSVENYAPGMCIGGDRFGNYEELLPVKKGRTYYECDIDTLGASSRGAKRIVFSNDGLIYYTDDHYESFTLLYGEAD